VSQKIKPNDKCHCNSGRKYKFCHRSIDLAKGPAKYRAAQEVYAKNWNTTANWYQNKGYYSWITEQLKLPKKPKILDIGCGCGQGLAEIVQCYGKDATIIAIDENPFCLSIARKSLLRIGMESTVKMRTVIKECDGLFECEFKPIKMKFENSVLLLESDICNDPYLMDFLSSQEPFDAVTIWMTGSHMYRQYNDDVVSSGINNDADHRLYVQNRAYEFADTILFSGGKIQVADRIGIPINQLIKDDLIRAHQDQASVTSIQNPVLTFTNYEEPSNSRTPMIVAPNASGCVPPIVQTAIISIISEKP